MLIHAYGNVRHQHLVLGHQHGFMLLVFKDAVWAPAYRRHMHALLATKIFMLVDPAMVDSNVTVIVQLNALEDWQPLQDAQACYVNAIVLTADTALRNIATGFRIHPI